ncbi:MAG: indole-3-glycerol phosphate synthase TrpC [Spirochaetota bacterium]
MGFKSIPPILGKIVEKKKLEIQEISLKKTPQPCEKSLKAALLAQEQAIIAECKKASPSAGVIREDYNPLSIAQEYQSLGAAAISVLTDQDFFQGSLSHLQAITNAVETPVLRKDFVISEKQIDEARLYGASATLLIVRILSEKRLQELLQHSQSLGMDVLVETHSQEEASIAENVGAEIIGINSRDLDTFTIDPGLISKVAQTLPDSICKVAESGVKTRQDYLQMTEFADAALIGTYFMRADDIANAYKSLLGQN